MYGMETTVRVNQEGERGFMPAGPVHWWLAEIWKNDVLTLTPVVGFAVGHAWRKQHIDKHDYFLDYEPDGFPLILDLVDGGYIATRSGREPVAETYVYSADGSVPPVGAALEAVLAAKRAGYNDLFSFSLPPEVVESVATARPTPEKVRLPPPSIHPLRHDDMNQGAEAMGVERHKPS